MTSKHRVMKILTLLNLINPGECLLSLTIQKVRRNDGEKSGGAPMTGMPEAHTL